MSHQGVSTAILGVDLGAGAIKVYGEPGGIELPSHVAFAGRRRRQARVSGLRTVNPPMEVITAQGRFYVGLGAHDWGRPVENLADERFLGAPETAALLYGALILYARQYRCTIESVRAIVGLTQSALIQDAGEDIVSGVRSWLVGEHAWQATEHDTPEAEAFTLSVQGVDVTSQAAGAMFDYFLDDRGEFIPARKPDYRRRSGS